MTSLAFEFFGALWFVYALSVPAGIVLLAHTTRSLAVSGVVTNHDRLRFLRAVSALGASLTCLLIGYMVAAHGQNPLCTSEASLRALNSLAGVVGTAFLSWMWLGDGAALIARFASLLSASDREYTTKQVWLAVALFGIVSWLFTMPAATWQHSLLQTRCTVEPPQLPNPLDIRSGVAVLVPEVQIPTLR